MSRLMAIAGKGGVGKTTFAALALNYFLQREGPVLAVDADPNSNLPVSLGLKPELTIGEVLEEFMSAKFKLPAGMTRQNWLETRLNQAVIESRGLDLVVMGRPEGPGCYCSPNAVLRDFLDRLRGNYQWVVLDNQAGMEHLSRRTAGKIDCLVFVADPAVKSLRTVQSLKQLAGELKLEPAKMFLALNRAGKIEPRVEQLIKNLKLDFLGALPEDPAIAEYDLAEKSLLLLPPNSPALQASERILENLAKRV